MRIGARPAPLMLLSVLLPAKYLIKFQSFRQRIPFPEADFRRAFSVSPLSCQQTDAQFRTKLTDILQKNVARVGEFCLLYAL